MLDSKYVNVQRTCTVIFLISLFISACSIFWCLNGFSIIVDKFISYEETSRYTFLVPSNRSDNLHRLSASQLSRNDMYTLIDISDFKFVINHFTCSKVQPVLLMLIHSAPSNFRKRNVIRETWGRQIPLVTTYFLVGLSENYTSALQKENEVYKDLIQGNFLDTYRNITYKHVMGLKWAIYHCLNAKYILKVDDDVFVNVASVLNFFRYKLPPWDENNLILCDTKSSSKVQRSWRSKWRVSPQEYPGQCYPTYCLGWAILYSIDAAFILYKEAQKEPFFWIDDVHVTGTLARNANLTQKSIKSLILLEKHMKVIIQESKVSKYFLFGPPNLLEYEIRALQKVVSDDPIVNPENS